MYRVTVLTLAGAEIATRDFPSRFEADSFARFASRDGRVASVRLAAAVGDEPVTAAGNPACRLIPA